MAINLTRQGGCLKYKDTSTGFVKYINLNKVDIERIRGNNVYLNDGSVYNYNNISTPSVASAEALADAIGTFKNEANAATGGGGGSVDSVFTRTGDVVSEAGDYDSDQITNESDVSGSTVSDALDELESQISALGGSEDMVIIFSDGDTITANTLIPPSGGEGHFTQSMGFIVPRAGQLKEIAFTTGVTSAVASETLTLSIRRVALGLGTTGSGTAITVSSGDVIGSVSLNSGGALGASYYRNNATVSINANVSAGDLIFCTISNFAFWSLSNVLVEARIQFD